MSCNDGNPNSKTKQISLIRKTLLIGLSAIFAPDWSSSETVVATHQVILTPKQNQRVGAHAHLKTILRNRLFRRSSPLPYRFLIHDRDRIFSTDLDEPVAPIG